ncbi:hypothetical protein Scep_023561 [Stephania cephalantha]|uniref:GTD-binding domain-containing protein n=1 Tax=Stephania cephalantha TaxID=152367 RepID=A0AAP0EUW7_9MAGN
MAERNSCSLCNSGMKIVALKEALCTQQQLLQKLYIELEEEREASATAASEALSMILRLQGEKAAEKMEAVHYRRMAEEKIQHADESLMIFRELLCEKEMEIASLMSQVEGYRRKQLGIGETQLGELCVQGMIGRSRSSPVDIIDGFSTKVVSEKENQGMAELYLKKSDEVSDRELIVPKADSQSFSTSLRLETFAHIGNKLNSWMSS